MARPVTAPAAPAPAVIPPAVTRQSVSLREVARRDVASTPGGAPVPVLDDDPPPRRALPSGGALYGSGALLSWGAFALTVYAGSPDVPAARVGFFVSLFGAVFFSLAPLLRLVALRLSHSRVYQQAAGAHARRQAALLSGFVVLNALLLLVRAWSELNVLLLFGTLAVVEVVALSRR